MNLNERVKKIRIYFCEDNNLKFAEKMEENPNTTSNWINGKRKLGKTILDKVLEKFPEVNPTWLLTGEGNMLKDEKSDVQFYDPEYLAKHKRRLIPFYDDVSTIGGVKGKIANVDDSSYPTEYIDTGDWFTDATAAIRHYGESMIEYPEGSILALKEVSERQLIVWGRDYVIETNEYRITKRIQRGKTDEFIRAYSSNVDTYPDGQLVHEPLDISWNDIRRISLVLGYVVKKNGGTMIFTSKK